MLLGLARLTTADRRPRPWLGLGLKGQRPFGIAGEHGQPPKLGEGERDVVRQLESVGDGQGLIKLADRDGKLLVSGAGRLPVGRDGAAARVAMAVLPYPAANDGSCARIAA